jgi:hypothetical protein
MAPKKKKAPKGEAEKAPEDNAHLQLVKEAAQYKRFCEDEERLYNQFLNEREKINYFWIVEKKTLAEKQAELRNKEREMQDLEERNQIELKMFQQRLKHLRFHQQDEIVELKTDAELALKLSQDQHRLTEAEIKKDKRTLKIMMKEAEVAQEDFIRMLKLEQDQKILELRQEFDSKARDLQQKYTQKMKTIREQMESARKSEIARIEDEKNQHIMKCMQKNAKEFQDIKVYYGDITSSNLDQIKRLKEEHEEIKKRQSSDAKHMFDLKQKNTQLSEPLRKAIRDVEALQEELRCYEVDKKRLAEVKEKIKEQEKTYSRLQFQQEALFQYLERVQMERDDVYDRFSKSVYEVQQKSGLKNFVFEKKLDTIQEALEVTVAEVNELVMSGSADQGVPGAVSQRLDEMIEYKNEFIAELHEEVQRIQDSHKQMVRAYSAKLAEYGIPTEELGFVAAE